MSTMLVKLTENLARSLQIEAESQRELMETLKATAFKSDKPISDAQMTAVMIVAQQYDLNPWTKEIYAYPDKGGIVPVVGVDGWSRIINNHPQFDGIEFNYSPETFECKKNGKIVHEWIECVITRKDRNKPIIAREYFDEVFRDVSFVTPWNSHPKRMHRHKAMIQCARIAFGFGGIYDSDEAEQMTEKVINPLPTEPVESFLSLLTRVETMTIEELSSIDTNKLSDDEKKQLRPIYSRRKKELSVVADIKPVTIAQKIRECKTHAEIDELESNLSADEWEDYRQALDDARDLLR